MNYDNPIATLFPGTSGRVVAALVRLHARGDERIETTTVAAEASVVPEQLRKVATRLALLGLLAFPVDEQITINREHVMWEALREVADPQRRIDAVITAILGEQLTAAAGGSVSAAVVGGPVAAGTASAFPDELHVSLVAPDPAVSDIPVAELADRISRAIGNACRVGLIAESNADLAAETDRFLPLPGGSSDRAAIQR